MNKAKIMLAMLCAVCVAAAASAETRRERRARALQKEGKYHEAIEMFAKTFSKKDSGVIGIGGIAECYMLLRDYRQAEVWLAKRLARPNASQKYQALYASALMYNGNLEGARYAIESGSFEGKDAMLAACDSAEAWNALPEPEYVVRNARALNSVYDDFAVLPYENEKLMYFCSNRPDIDPKKSKPKPKSSRTKEKEMPAAPAGFVRIFEAVPVNRKSKGIDTIYSPTILFQDPAPASEVVNAKNANNGPLSYSNSRISVIYYSQSASKSRAANKDGEAARNLEIFYRLNGFTSGGDDAPPNPAVPFAFNKPETHSVTHPCMSSDGKVLYFVSDMAGGKGGKDIWYSELTAKGWGAPENCGSINTPGDEVFPTMDSKGNLYFSSNGHAGMGGLDIFVAKGSKNKWQRPENLRPPINSAADDFYLIKTGDGMRGYFSSNRAGGAGGDDIYSFAPFIEIKAPVLMDIRVSADYGELYTPQAMLADISRQPVFPPALFAGIGIAPEEDDDEQPEGNALLLGGREGVPVTIKTADSKSQAPIPAVKVCVTHNATLASLCKPTNADGWVVFEVAGREEYTIRAFKRNYALTSPPLPLKSAKPDQSLYVIMKQVKREFHDIDNDLKRQKKQKPAVGRGKREYRVHILAIDKSSKLDRSYFDPIKEAFPRMQIQLYKDKRYKRYTLGSFASAAEAREHMRRVTALGYGSKNEREKCFVAVFINGKHLPKDNIYASGKGRGRKR